ncbi:MAG: MBG domain-containing protein, partial [Ferruginibacter sp.]|nr:MBG domain-containing protein [Ferruginibacter sp.]
MFLTLGVNYAQGQATVTTDKPDYAPRSNAVFTGAGFQPGESVQLKVKNLFRACNTVSADSSYLPWTVIADASGGFVTNWTVCDCAGDSLRLKATGLTSARIAYAYFTDGNVTFTTGGLPPSPAGSNSVNVDYRYYINGSTLSGPLSGSTSFLVAVSNNKEIYFTYPATKTTSNGNVYSLVDVTVSNGGSVAPSGISGYQLQFTSPQSNARTITGNYQLSCTAPTISGQPSAQSLTYGGSNPIFSVTAGGSGLSYQWQYNTPALPTIWNNVGANSTSYTVPGPDLSFNGRQYRVVVTGTCGNVTSTSALLTVNAKALTVTADNRTKTYGDAVTFAGTEFTTAGLVNGDAVASVTLTSAGAAATATLAGSPYSIVPSAATGTGLSNYTLSYTNGALTVNARPATITANAKSKIYGEANPALDAVVAGTANGDVLNYTLATTATVTSGVGPYPITVTVGSNPNYSVTPTDGVLTVTQRPATITANAKSKIYGDANPALDAVVTGTANGDVLNYTLATTATVTSGVGTYPITVTLGSNPNYSVTPTDALLTVTQRPATITANAKSKIYGDANPALDATVTGTVNGDVLNYTLATT